MLTSLVVDASNPGPRAGELDPRVKTGAPSMAAPSGTLLSQRHEWLEVRLAARNIRLVD